MITLSREQVAEQGEAIYEQLRPLVETPENIGKMMVIDVESGDYEIAKRGVEANDRLEERRPDGRFYGIRIGYVVAESFGGLMPRRKPL